ncbi:MAG: hypothetical protein H0V82_05875 [Candidatus Protochlamydia sp.]|nr:hypothetical protein [Candidatus Protochlamydia sp.]
MNIAATCINSLGNNTELSAYETTVMLSKSRSYLWDNKTALQDDIKTIEKHLQECKNLANDGIIADEIIDILKSENVGINLWYEIPLKIIIENYILDLQ